jgi:hypothetical protein
VDKKAAINKDVRKLAEVFLQHGTIQKILPTVSCYLPYYETEYINRVLFPLMSFCMGQAE